MKPLRRVARGAARRLGYDIVRTGAAPAGRPLAERRAAVLRRLQIEVVFDIGANVGQHASELRRFGYAGRIISVEPLTTAFAELEAAASGDPKWDCVNVAIGPEGGRGEINISGYSESSSLLPMNQSHIDALPSSAYVGTETVEITTIDALAGPVLLTSGPAWLKLDVQGFEGPVLAGGAATLSRFSGVECELSLVELYAGQALLADVVAQLARHSFRPVWMDPGFVDPHTGDALQLNGLFVGREATSPAPR